jgi:hypothetical protein
MRSTYSWIFPVEVDAIKFMLVHERNEVILELLTVRRLCRLAENLEGSGLSTESPSTEGYDLLDVCHALEKFKLL